MRDNRKEKMDTRTDKQVQEDMINSINELQDCLLYTSPSPRD